MKTILFIGMLVGSTLLSLNCAPEKPIGGVVAQPKKIPVGSYAPDIPFTSANDQQTTLHKVRQPIALLAFSFSPGVACCRLDPTLVKASSHFRSLPVSVIQVSLPTSKCPHGPGCTEACNIDQGRLISLCDSDHIAWQAFGMPETNTVYLIGENGEVVDQGTIDTLHLLMNKAKQMGQDIEARYEGD